MTRTRKVLAVMMALVMTMSMMFAMTTNVFAATNITATDSAMYHNFAYIVTNENGTTSYTDANGTAITGFTVKASQAGSYWQAIGFNSQTDAQNVQWTSSDESIATVSSGTAVASVSGTAGTYDSQANVTLVGTTAGSCTIEASFDGGSVNFTVVVEKASANTAVSNVRVIIEDYDTSELWEDATVTASAPSAGSAFYQQAYAAQTFATAATALEAYTTNKNYSLTVDSLGSYISSIKGIGPDSSYVYGWNYCVIRQVGGNWAVVDASLGIGASEFGVKSGDVVYWTYAPYGDVADLQAIKVDELNGVY